MHRNNCFGSWGDGRFDLFGSDHQRIAVDIDHHRRRTQQDNHIDRGNPRHRRGDHLITCGYVQRHQRDVHTCCS
ncbi:hypothetical protein D3C73_993810 [compost metagenome]